MCLPTRLNSLCVALLGLSSVGLAQNYVTSPRGYDFIEGDANASVGGYPGGRYQFVDGDQRGNPMTIQSTAYRYDNLIYTTAQGIGRTWTAVTVDMSECDINSTTSTFSKNPTTTPTRVFSGKVTWPSQIGKPSKFPADFSVVFPFQTNWVYTGKMDILADQTFDGGVLANNSAWASTTWAYYYVDGVDLSRAAYTTSRELGEGGYLKGCDDRNSANLYGAQLSSNLYFYSRSYSNQNYAGNLVFSQTGNYFGPNALVITALAVKSVPAGWTFPGVHCNKVYLDPNFALGLFYQTASSSGSLPQLGLGGTYGIPAPAGVAGVEIATQAIWRDTKNHSSLISSAATLTVPSEPVFSQRQVIYHYDAKAVNGFGPQPNNANQVVRYAR